MTYQMVRQIHVQTIPICILGEDNQIFDSAFPNMFRTLLLLEKLNLIGNLQVLRLQWEPRVDCLFNDGDIDVHVQTESGYLKIYYSRQSR